jgi:hypothetical protein
MITVVLAHGQGRSQLLNKVSVFRQADAFQAWVCMVRDAAALEQRGLALSIQMHHRRMHSYLQAWRLHCLQKQAHSRMLMRLLNKKAQSRLNSSFCAWSSYVANFR